MTTPNTSLPPNGRAWTGAVIWRIAIALVSTFSLFTIAFAAVHYGIRGLHLTMAPYPTMLLTVAVAFLLIAGVGATLGHMFGSRQRDQWQSLLDAVGQIAQGNFRVRVDPEGLSGHQGGKDHPVHQLVQGINEMASELARIEDLRQEFISNVSHEIQSPLAAIGGFAKLLQSSAASTEEDKQYLDIIRTESLRLSRLTENLLKLTALESDYPAIDQVACRIDHQVRDGIIALEPLWSEKRLTMNVALPALTTAGDPDLLQQVWMNLLTNAIKFTPVGGSISVTGEALDQAVRVTIADTGIGIPFAEHDRIFERFYKVDKARNRMETGSGLGLAIVKKIVDLHAGRIAIMSAERKGTTVTVELPRV